MVNNSDRPRCKPRVFHPSYIGVYIGIGATVFWVYVALYSLGIVRWRLFSMADQFSASATPLWIFLGATCGATVFMAVIARRTRIMTASTELRVRTLRGTQTIEWDDIAEVRIRVMNGDLEISTENERIKVRRIAGKALQSEIERHMAEHGAAHRVRIIRGTGRTQR